MEKEKYILKVEPITCVHIGNGDELTPLDYMLVKSKQYVVYDSDVILQQIAGNKEKFTIFDRASTSNNMIKLQDFFHNEILPNNDTNRFNYGALKYLCHVTKEFAENYNHNEKTDPLENGRFVQQMYHNERTGQPVIPGSSLKGSIRTAILNGLLDEYTMVSNLKNLKDDKMQKELLGKYKDAKQDPFRAVEIADCSFEGKGTQMVGLIKNVKKGKDNELEEHNTSTLQAEVIKGELCSKETSVLGIANMRINSELTRIELPEKVISKKVTKEVIIKSCNSFYLKTFKEDYNKFYKDAVDKVDSITQLHKKLKEIADPQINPQTNSFIIKVGRWSQVEYVTYGHDFRNPTAKKGWGGTRWLFNNDGQYLPLGWCKCTIEET